MYQQNVHFKRYSGFLTHAIGMSFKIQIFKYGTKYTLIGKFKDLHHTCKYKTVKTLLPFPLKKHISSLRKKNNWKKF